MTMEKDFWRDVQVNKEASQTPSSSITTHTPPHGIIGGQNNPFPV